MAKILLVEDDLSLAGMICAWLSSERYQVEQSNDGDDAISRLKLYEYDLIILDWELPGASGVEICRQYRARGGASPVLMLTGKNMIEDKETGFTSGADDYLTKPFDMRELGARLKALLRRTQVKQVGNLRTRDLEMDVDAFKVTRQAEEIKLTKKEFELLELLLRNKNQVFSIEAFLDRLWSNNDDASEQTVRVHMNRLRTKLTKPGEESLIKTVHGKGYIIEEC